MKIMVPLDGSRFSEEALPMAFEIAAARGAEVHITRVHTILPVTEVVASFCGAASMDQLVRDAEIASVHRFVKEYSDCGVVTRAFTLDGAVDSALAAHIEAYAIDLVIMTTHGRGGISRAWLGSTADRLVRATSVPIVLVRPNGRKRGVSAGDTPGRILIPLDGSMLSESVIEPAIAFGQPMSAAYTLMHVTAPPIVASADASEYFASDAFEVRVQAEKYLEREAARLRERGFDVNTRVMIQPNVAAAIVEEAIELGCRFIAMATHGRTGWSRIALGSVADKVLRSAPVPILLMRPQPAHVAAKIA